MATLSRHELRDSPIARPGRIGDKAGILGLVAPCNPEPPVFAPVSSPGVAAEPVRGAILRATPAGNLNGMVQRGSGGVCRRRDREAGRSAGAAHTGPLHTAYCLTAQFGWPPVQSALLPLRPSRRSAAKPLLCC